MDLIFQVHKQLTPAVERAVDINCRNFIDATRHRIAVRFAYPNIFLPYSINIYLQDEKWKQYNLQSEINLNRFIEEMADFGLRLDGYICGE